MAFSIKSFAPKPAALLGLAAILLVVSIVSVLVGFTRSDEARHAFYDPDTLYIPALLNDIENDVDLSDWRLTPAPYFFPDIAAFGVLQMLPGNMHTVIMSFAALQPLILAAAMLLLATVLYKGQWLPKLLVLLMVSFFLMFSSTPGTTVGDSRFGSVCFHAFLSGFHFSLLTMTFLCGAACMKLIDASASRSAMTCSAVIFFVIATATLVSDPLFLVQYVGPAAAVIALAALLKPERRSRLLTALLLHIGVVWAAWGIEFLLPQQGQLLGTVSGSEGGIGETSTAFAQELWANLADPSFVIRILWVFFLIKLIVLAVQALRRSHRSELLKDGRAALILFIAAMFCANIISVVIAAKLWPRHYLPVMLLPAFFAWPFLLPKEQPVTERPVSRLLLAVVLVLCIAVQIPTICRAGRIAQLADYYPDWIREMDETAAEYGITTGMAGYQQSKPISLLSRNDVTAVQTLRNLRPYHWINNLAWYDRDMEFVLIAPEPNAVAPSDRSAIINVFGKPAAVREFDWGTLLVYGRDEDKFLRDFFRNSSLLANFSEPGSSHDFYPSSVLSTMGRVEGTSRVVDPDEPGDGYLTSARYRNLPLGRYALAIRFDVEPDPAGNSGVCQIIGKIDGFPALVEEIALSSALPPGKGAGGTFIIGDTPELDIRVIRKGASRLALHSMTLERIE